MQSRHSGWITNLPHGLGTNRVPSPQLGLVRSKSWLSSCAFVTLAVQNSSLRSEPMSKVCHAASEIRYSPAPTYKFAWKVERSLKSLFDTPVQRICSQECGLLTSTAAAQAVATQCGKFSYQIFTYLFTYGK